MKKETIKAYIRGCLSVFGYHLPRKKLSSNKPIDIKIGSFDDDIKALNEDFDKVRDDLNTVFNKLYENENNQLEKEKLQKSYNELAKIIEKLRPGQ